MDKETKAKREVKTKSLDFAAHTNVINAAINLGMNKPYIVDGKDSDENIVRDAKGLTGHIARVTKESIYNPTRVNKGTGYGVTGTKKELSQIGKETTNAQITNIPHSYSVAPAAFVNYAPDTSVSVTPDTTGLSAVHYTTDISISKHHAERITKDNLLAEDNIE